MNDILCILKTLVSRGLAFSFDLVEFACNGLSVAGLITWLATECSYLLRTKHTLSFPTHLQIETTIRCNLRCPVRHIPFARNLPYDIGQAALRTAMLIFLLFNAAKEKSLVQDLQAVQS